jgi:hypothetical protein
MATFQPASADQGARPTPTMTATALPALDLPDWVRDPDADVIALYTYPEMDDSQNKLTFINVVTDERFAPELPYVDSVGWAKAADEVYLKLNRYQSMGADNSGGFVEYVNLANGKLTRYSYGDPNILVNVIKPLDAAWTSNGANLSYQLVVQSNWITMGTSHSAYQMESHTDIILKNAATGSTTSLYGGKLTTSSNIQSLNVQWFDQGQRLAVWRNYVKDEARDASFANGIYEGGGDQVDIFDTNGELLNSYTDLQQVRWSPQHSRMLYRDYYDDSIICIRDTESPNWSDKDCDFLEGWQSTNHSRVLNYQWSLDGKAVIFSYVQDDEQGGGLCVAQGTGLRIKCPIQRKFTNPDHHFFGIYDDQPNATYGLFYYLDGVSSDEYDNTPREKGLCLVNQTDYTVDCITDHLLPSDTYERDTTVSSSGDWLALMYAGQGDTRHEGACMVNLQNATANCSDIPEDDGYIDTVGWSPSSRFFLVINAAYGRGGDDKTFSQFGIFDAETGAYRDEGFALYETNIPSLWRPSLQP